MRLGLSNSFRQVGLVLLKSSIRKTMSSLGKNMKKNSVIILSLCALFLFFKYIAQLYPSLISDELMQSYGYDGVMLAIMASSYYYSYTFMQIGAGLIIDRYAIRLPMFIAIALIAVMLLVFTHTTNFYLMCISRAFMGVGASFATVLYMKCAAQYAPPKAFGLISSLLATATMLGAACGGTPVALLFQAVGWREGLNIMAFIGLAMAFAVLIFQKTQGDVVPHASMQKTFDNIKSVLKSKNNWLLLVYSGMTFSPVAILGGLWGTPFLMAKYNVAAPSAAFFLSMMFVGHAVGAPVWAIISAQMERRKSLMHFANLCALIMICMIIYGGFSYTTSVVLFFMFGFSVSCFMLSFELCREINPIYMMGLAVAFINSGEGIVGSVVEPLIGKILDLGKTGAVFSLQNYEAALTILPCCYILSSFALAFMVRKNQIEN